MATGGAFRCVSSVDRPPAREELFEVAANPFEGSLDIPPELLETGVPVALSRPLDRFLWRRLGCFNRFGPPRGGQHLTGFCVKGNSADQIASGVVGMQIPSRRSLALRVIEEIAEGFRLDARGLGRRVRPAAEVAPGGGFF